MEKSFKRYGFTLTELLIALGVIGILCAVLIPIVMHIMPNQNIIMAKRAYYTVQSIVSELINDEACYPDKKNVAGNMMRYGLDDEYLYPNCNGYSGNGAASSANSKFVTLMTDKLAVSADSNNNFQTNDGIFWSVSSSYTFNPASDKGGYTRIYVDVNGNDPPNCSSGTSYAENITGLTKYNTSCSGVKDLDEFALNVYGDGTIKFTEESSWAKEAVKLNADISKTTEGTKTEEEEEETETE